MMGEGEMVIKSEGDIVLVRRAARDADTQGRNIEWDLERLPAVEGDRALLKQVWVNLLSNAVKYTRPHHLAKIKIGCAAKSGEWEFFVQDNGVGFDMR